MERTAEIVILPEPFDSPVAAELITAVQREYVVRYGDEDATPVDPFEFTPPHGLFLVAWREGLPVGSGGWRVYAEDPERGTAELKRMYVAPQARRLGLARRLLAELERTAAAAGMGRMILETGIAQPEAIALYTGAGYVPIAKFGAYAGEPNSRCFGRDLISG